MPRLPDSERRVPWRDLPGYEQIVAAKSGRMTSYDGVRPGPVFTPVPIASYGAGMLAAVGLMAGIWARTEKGQGQRVHTSLLHALSVYDMTSGHGNRTHLPPEPGRVYGVMRVPFMTAPTKDGRFIQMCSRQAHHYRRWLAELGLEALLDDPELPNAPDLWPSEERLSEAIERHQTRHEAAQPPKTGWRSSQPRTSAAIRSWPPGSSWIIRSAPRTGGAKKYSTMTWVQQCRSALLGCIPKRRRWSARPPPGSVSTPTMC